MGRNGFVIVVLDHIVVGAVLLITANVRVLFVLFVVVVVVVVVELVDFRRELWRLRVVPKGGGGG
jgi:hypothetical protein